MHSTKRVFWGLCFIVIAVMIILNQTGVMAVTLSAGKIIIGILALLLLVEGIINKEFGGIFLSLGLFWMTFGEMIGLPKVSVWVILLVVLLLTIGFNSIFPKKNKHFHWEKVEGYDKSNPVNEHQTITDMEENGYVYCSNHFGALAKYVNCSDFRGASVKNSFGELKVYFDRAYIVTSPVDINLNNSFGELQVFVPKDWNVKLNVSVFAGDCKNQYHTGNENGPEVRISGSVSFGEIQIIYV